MGTPLRWDMPGIRWDDPGLFWNGNLPERITMTDDNRVSATMADADIAAILTKIGEIRALLPFMISLSAEGRTALPKLGDKTVGFHDKAQGYMVTNPEFLPGFTDMAEVNKDAALRDQLLEVYPELKTFFDAFEDTLMVV